MDDGGIVRKKPFVLPEEEGYYWEQYFRLGLHEPGSYWVLWRVSRTGLVVIDTAKTEDEMILKETEHALGVI